MVRSNINQVLRRSPIWSCFQPWQLNMGVPSNLDVVSFPTWVSLRHLSYEYHAHAIAWSLGEVIGIDTSKKTLKDPRYCINLKVNKGWVTSIALSKEEGILPTQHLLVVYDNLPFRCRSCHKWKHKVRDCKDNKKTRVKGIQNTVWRIWGGLPPSKWLHLP